MKYNKIRLFDEWLSASEIGRRHGLSVPTVLRRYYVLGLRGKKLLAAPGTLPKAANGEHMPYRSQRLPTPLQARARLRKAKASLTMAIERLAHARAMGETKRTIERLEKIMRRAEVRRMYCTSMVESADEFDKDKREAA